jgi:hypothetical protein
MIKMKKQEKIRPLADIIERHVALLPGVNRQYHAWPTWLRIYLALRIQVMKVQHERPMYTEIPGIDKNATEEDKVQFLSDLKLPVNTNEMDMYLGMAPDDAARLTMALLAHTANSIWSLASRSDDDIMETSVTQLIHWMFPFCLTDYDKSMLTNVVHAWPELSRIAGHLRDALMSDSMAKMTADCIRLAIHNEVYTAYQAVQAYIKATDDLSVVEVLGNGGDRLFNPSAMSDDIMSVIFNRALALIMNL